MGFFILLLFGLVCWAIVTARDALTLATSVAAELRDARTEWRTQRKENIVAPPPRTGHEFKPPPPVVVQGVVEKPVSPPPPRPQQIERTEKLAPVAPPPVPTIPKITHSEPIKEQEASPTLQINWEQFLGVKMFAWVGGLLAFLAMAFFVKLSFEKGWISNEMRIITSAITGFIALGGGIKLHSNLRYRVMAQTLCATGVLMLYGTIYAALSLYGFIGHGSSFALMTGVTAVAFGLSVRLNAQVIAVLGLLGGFLTPGLCSSGQDNAVGLFSYVLLLDVGLLLVVRHRGWNYLAVLAALCTGLTELAWAASYFNETTYGSDARIWLVVAVLTGYPLLFALTSHGLPLSDSQSHRTTTSVWILCTPLLILSFWMLDMSAVASNPIVGMVQMIALLASLSLCGPDMKANFGSALAGLGIATVHGIASVGAENGSHGLLWFSYAVFIALAGAISERRLGWKHAPVAVAVATAFTQLFWFAKVLASPPIDQSRLLLVLLAFVGMGAMHFAIRRGGRGVVEQLILVCSAMIAGFGLLVSDLHAGWIYAYILALNLIVMRAVWVRPDWHTAHPVTTLAVFAHLATWTLTEMENDQLMLALGLYLGFGVLNTCFSLWMIKRNPTITGSGASWMPVLSIILMMIPVVTTSELSVMIWPAFLLGNLVVMAVAWYRGRLINVLIGMALTLVAALMWQDGLPTTPDTLNKFLGVIGGVTLVFMTATSMLLRRFVRAQVGSDELPAIVLPISAAIMPFALLCIITSRLSDASMVPVFGFALLLVLFLLGLAVWQKLGALAFAAMAATTSVMVVWHSHHYESAYKVDALAWYVGFTLLFTAFPHIFRSRFSTDTWPWITSALAAPATFLLVQNVVMPIDHRGLLPLMYALPSLFSLLLIKTSPVRQSQLAWYGGVALFFVTLTFPYEFTQQWLTLSWALEGAALIWLYTRVPQKGLVWVGLALLAAVFARLALNPAILVSYERMARVIWNWHLAVYGTAVVGTVAAATWLRAPMTEIRGVRIKPILAGMAGVLAFLWINIEITDAFTPTGRVGLLIDFNNQSIGRRMTYSIAWAAYALLLIVVGFVKHARLARYAGIALMSITILKVFFRDLSTLESIYRIAALAAVAIMALAASFVYQRWFEKTGKSH